MPWVKAHVEGDVNDAIEEVQEMYGCNKTEATERLLRLGAMAHDDGREVDADA